MNCDSRKVKQGLSIWIKITLWDSDRADRRLVPFSILLLMKCYQMSLNSEFSERPPHFYESYDFNLPQFSYG